MEPGRDAWELLERVWMTDGPFKIALPVGPVTIARKLGIEVFESDELAPGVAAVLRKRSGYEDPEIYLDVVDSPPRERFTCARALGHYARNIEMRRGDAWEFVDGRESLDVSIGDAEDSFATEFAMELLMPRIALREFADTSSTVALAGVFGVPGDVMGFRLDQIGGRRR
jgi:hypothetical protein